MTNLSYKARDDESRYGSWNSDVRIGTSAYLTDVAYTDSFNLGDDSDKAFYAMPYKYAQLKYSDQTVHIQDAKFDIDTFHGRYGTNKASQNNQGLVTTFPFTIASELNIGPIQITGKFTAIISMFHLFFHPCGLCSTIGICPKIGI